jgi:hypothetical protein
MILSFATSLLVLATLSGCGAQRYPWRELRTEDNTPYIVSVRWFEDDIDRAHKPFELMVSSKYDKKSVYHVLFVEQCKNVFIVQQPQDLYIFYDRLDLRAFSNFRPNVSFPRPHLCDLENNVCMKSLTFANGSSHVAHRLCQIKDHGQTITVY